MVKIWKVDFSYFSNDSDDSTTSSEDQDHKKIFELEEASENVEEETENIEMIVSWNEDSNENELSDEKSIIFHDQMITDLNAVPTLNNTDLFSRKRLILFAAIVAIMALAKSAIERYTSKTKKEKSYRFEAIFSQISHISSNFTLQNLDSTQYNSIEWLADFDRRKVDPDDPELEERYILTVLFFSTKGDSWPYNAHWLTSAHICEWDNIDCINVNGYDKVSSLHLFENKLEGKIPSEILKLSNLGKVVRK